MHSFTATIAAAVVVTALFGSVSACSEDAGAGGGAGADGGGDGSGPSGAGGAVAGGGTAGGGTSPTGGATGTGGQLMEAPDGKVGVFVAAGHGARTLTSCDDGRTWIANNQYEDVDVDHSPYTDKGFIFADGKFVQAVGWGKPNSVKVSTNGVDWTLHLIDGGGAGITYLVEPTPRFVTYNGWGSCMQSADAVTWEKCPSERRHNYAENIRDVGGGSAWVGMGGDPVDLKKDQVIYATGVGALFSFDGGVTWQHEDSCDLAGGFGNLGQTGGFAVGGSVFAAVSQHGNWCATADAGQTWKSGDMDGPDNSKGVSGKLTFLDGMFWAAAGDKAYRSADGVDWKPLTFKPEGTKIHALARSTETGTFVGIERIKGEKARLYWSEDGETWNLVEGPEGPTLRRVSFGIVDASVACPGK